MLCKLQRTFTPFVAKFCNGGYLISDVMGFTKVVDIYIISVVDIVTLCESQWTFTPFVACEWYTFSDVIGIYKITVDIN